MPKVYKRASVNEVASLGFATLNGGHVLVSDVWSMTGELIFVYFRTTGGSGGSVTTVTTLEELTDAVASDDPKIVIIQGPSRPSFVANRTSFYAL